MSGQYLQHILRRPHQLWPNRMPQQIAYRAPRIPPANEPAQATPPPAYTAWRNYSKSHYVIHIQRERQPRSLAVEPVHPHITHGFATKHHRASSIDGPFGLPITRMDRIRDRRNSGSRLITDLNQHRNPETTEKAQHIIAMQTHATTNDAMTPLRYQYRHVGHMRCLTRTIRQPSNEPATTNTHQTTMPYRKTLPTQKGKPDLSAFSSHSTPTNTTASSMYHGQSNCRRTTAPATASTRSHIINLLSSKTAS
ncbi:hypothetical protein SAMN04489749_1705 [Bifidobacterium longum]|uniref:Uncharacterized protein n=1 Tax=Bifidobacterium longum subsp. suis TaxID=1695 RepID=A0A087BLV7_BIFLN|nr:hypothetical protein BLSS_1692 [Bifidobacterium longum subsp. suis]SDO62146.1 hypothetical protein SAMN04489749_1705 [Bifidobacterium longum]